MSQIRKILSQEKIAIAWSAEGFVAPRKASPLWNLLRAPPPRADPRARFPDETRQGLIDSDAGGFSRWRK